MDIVLLKDVEKLGSEGSVVQVKPGYARNYLLPRGLAAQASPHQLQLAEAAKQKRQEKADRAKSTFIALKQKLEALSLTQKLMIGEENKAFGSISANDIAQALAQEGLPVEKHMIHLEQPIKTLGAFEVPVRLHAEVTATVKVSVVKA